MADTTQSLLDEATTQLERTRVLSGNGYNERLIQRLIDQLRLVDAERQALTAAEPAPADQYPTEQRLREITKAAIDRRPYDNRTRREIRGLENVIARDIAFELSKES